jgi:putative spermidine/putrescine transport system substrate-binding protein
MLARLGAAAALVVMGASAQAQELVINSFGGAYEKTHRELVIDPFERMTGAKVRILTAYSADMLAQLRAQKDAPQVDVAHFSGGVEATAAADGLLEPIPPAALSSYADLYPFAVQNMAKGEGPAYSAAVLGLLYDTEKVRPAPTSWLDVFDPRFKDQVVLTDFSNNWGLLSFLMINQVLGGSLDDIRPGLDKVRTILPTSTIVAKSPEIQQAFAQGQAWIAPYAQDYGFTLTRAGLPVAFAAPKEGAVFSPITINLVKGARNRDLALRFIDFSLRPEASAGWAEAFRYSPVNRKAVLSPEAAKGVLAGEEATKGLVAFDSIKIGQMRGAWTEAWNRAIAR